MTVKTTDEVAYAELDLLSDMARSVLKNKAIIKYICTHSRNINEQDDVVKAIRDVSRMMPKIVRNIEIEKLKINMEACGEDEPRRTRN